MTTSEDVELSGLPKDSQLSCIQQVPFAKYTDQRNTKGARIVQKRWCTTQGNMSKRKNCILFWLDPSSQIGESFKCLIKNLGLFLRLAELPTHLFLEITKYSREVCAGIESSGWGGKKENKIEVGGLFCRSDLLYEHHFVATLLLATARNGCNLLRWNVAHEAGQACTAASLFPLREHFLQLPGAVFSQS